MHATTPAPDNPYAAPTQIDAAAGEAPPSGPAPSNGVGLRVGWTVAFLVNLVVPLTIGWNVTEQGGRAGMFAGCLVLFALGWLVCSSYPSQILSINVGGIGTAMAQVFPVPQIAAGCVGVLVAQRIERLAFVATPEQDAMPAVFTNLGGLIATLLTGILLITLALLTGMVLRALYQLVSRTPTDPVVAGESPEQ